MKHLVTSLVLSRLEYCNAILAGLPASTLMPLQRACKNVAARWSSITTALRDLHWLLVKHRITFKVATLMHQALHRRCPPYLADLVAFSLTDSQRQLRYTTTRAAAIQELVPSSEDGPSLSAALTCGTVFLHRSAPSTLDSSFRCALKAHLCQLAFNN